MEMSTFNCLQSVKGGYTTLDYLITEDIGYDCEPILENEFSLDPEDTIIPVPDNGAQVEEQKIVKPEGEQYVKTRPQINVFKSSENLYIPPSNCLITLHERFSKLQSNILKYELNSVFTNPNLPSFDFAGRYNRLMKFNPYKPKFTKPIIKASAKLKKQSINNSLLSIKQLNPNDSEFWKHRYSFANLWAKFRTGPKKSLEELDNEIDDYMISKGRSADENSKIKEQLDKEIDTYMTTNGKFMKQGNSLSKTYGGKTLSNEKPFSLMSTMREFADVKVLNDNLNNSDHLDKNDLDMELDVYMQARNKNEDKNTTNIEVENYDLVDFTFDDDNISDI